MTSRNQHIAVIDFGSSITRILVVEESKSARVIAYEQEKTQGVKHGVIVDLDKATETIQRLIQKVRKKMDHRLLKVFCSIAGESVESKSSHGMVKVRHQEINHYDLEDLVSTAKAIHLENKLVIHLLPKQYKVDNQEGVKDPLGMYGVRLEGDFHLVLGDKGVAQNIIRCMDRAGLNCEGLIFGPIGLAEAVLTLDEKQQGVVIVDMGEGTTDFTMFFNGVAMYSGSIPIGGGAVTRDIAHKLQINNQDAEAYKLSVSDTAGVEDLESVIDARYEQILRFVDMSLVNAGLKSRVNRGYVLCGGASTYPGIHKIVEEVCNTTSRAGRLLTSSSSMSHEWLSSVGLVYYVQQKGGGQFLRGNNACRQAFKMLQRWLELYF